ncbi:MAG: tetratricopeptide repeat protein [Planctomycetia bacterium]
MAPVEERVRQWSELVRQQAAGLEKEKWAAAAALIGPLQEELRRAVNPAVAATADLAALADPVAAGMARCIRAGRERNAAAWNAAAGEVYTLVRDYPAKQTPCGQAVFRWLLAERPEGIDVVDFQCRVIADQMAAWNGGPPTLALEAIDIVVLRPGWGWAAFPADGREVVLRFNAAIGKGILEQLGRNLAHVEFIQRFRLSRLGQGWRETTAGEEVAVALVEKDAFRRHGVHFDPFGYRGSPTVGLMWLVRSDFPGLVERFPPDTFFADMFIEESRQSGWFDPAYFSVSQDVGGKVATAAAEKLAEFTALATGPGNPLGYGAPAGRPRWTWEQLVTWYARSAFAAPAARERLAQATAAAWGKTRHDAWATGYLAVPTDPGAVLEPAGRAATFAAFTAMMERMPALRGRGFLPPLRALEGLAAADVQPAELAALVAILAAAPPPGPPPPARVHEPPLLVRTVTGGLAAQGRFAELPPRALQCWRILRENTNPVFMAELAAVAAAAGKAGHPEVAVALADTATELLGTALPEQVRTVLAAARTEALLAIGGTNPVPPSDPRWSGFEAQLAFTAGRLQTAWERYLARPAMFAEMHKELDPTFTLWLIRENTQAGAFDRARELGQLVLGWMEAQPAAVDAESQAAVLVAYADIAKARKEYPQARALYERIIAADVLQGTVGARDAAIRVAEVDRLTRQFDTARQRLEKLARSQDRTLQAEALYELAMLEADQDQIEEAAAFLEQCFTRTPNHVNGRILEGRLNLLRRKFDVAAKVKLGVLGDRKFLIPGKPLEVDLEDRNLAVVGKATQIEIRAWTDGGDEERFGLFPFGDSKTRFSGQVATQLAAPAKGDRVLQVRGGDVVRYAFADPTLAGAALGEAAAMTVVTDAELFASSGAILGKEEQENRALERMIRERLRLDDGLDRRMALAAVRSEDQVKPGNGINVRVVDADRSTTGDRDEVEVLAATASGDALRLRLRETAGFSGVFEGVVPTGASQATAFASDAREGNDAAWVIAPASDTPWIAQPDSVRPKWLAVDLNDNVPLGTLTVRAAVPGRRLRDFLVQTSMNGRDFRSLAQWRADRKTGFRPWDGSPTLDLVRLVGAEPPARLEDFEAYLDRGRFASDSPLVSLPVETLAAAFDATVGGRADALGLDRVTNWYVARWRAAFTVPRDQVRTFTLHPRSPRTHARYLLAVDGVVPGNPEQPLAVTSRLDAGPHRIEIYALAHRPDGLDFELRYDVPEAPFVAAVPRQFFPGPADPGIRERFAQPPAEVRAAEDGGRFTVAFAAGARARVVRLLIADYESDAPAVESLALTDAGGDAILPTARSFRDLAENDTLEIIPGDRITVSYDDPTVITPTRARQDRVLTATFTHAELSAAFVEFAAGEQGRRATYIPMRRFKPGDTVKVFINDPDMDVSDEADTVAFTVAAGDGPPTALEALETEPHSGVFLGTVFPVATEPQRPADIRVAAGAPLVLVYRDRDNTDPGIPWDRIGRVAQIGSEAPELRVYDVASRPLDAAEVAAAAASAPVRRIDEFVPVTRELVAVRPAEPAATGRAATALVDGPLLVELLAPRIAQSPNSVAEIYVQTAAGRRALGRPIAAGEFPLDAPGTIRLRSHPGVPRAFEPPPGAARVVVRGDQDATDAVSAGRFTFPVVMQLGGLPRGSLAEVEYRLDDSERPPALQIRGDDTIHVGHRFRTESGAERWIVQEVALTSDAAFDVMDRRYQEPVNATFVGDVLHVRVIQPGRDTGDDKDTVLVAARSGTSALELPLTETFGHSGIFKGTLRLAIPGVAGTDAGDGRTLPVGFGAEVRLTYDAGRNAALVRTVSIFPGGDGELVPFTKQFNDAEIAVQTQFTVAEAWFELAKRHRELGQESLARREIAQGKKLLEEAIRDYPNTATRAQADYLLANLAFEFSKDAANEEIARQHALEAVSRFSDIVASHPDSEYAPKSQYKKALVLERLGQMDQACEEYVKLSYRYPDNELVAETIARLGQYFLSKGKEFDDAAAAATDAVEREKVVLKGREMFTTAAQVFGRLGERFPQHALAGKTAMLSAQCFLRAKDFPRAIAGFEAIVTRGSADKDLLAEAMYWAGEANLQRKDPRNAYRAFKKLTWDYPESKWAKFARGRLTEEAMVTVEAAENRDR